MGSTAAHWAAMGEFADVVLLDINPGAAKGKALDLNQASCVGMFDALVTGTDRYEDIAGSDVVIITAGLPRKPGMSRDDLLASNAKIMRTVCEGVKKHAPHSMVIVVSNPLDAMCYVAHKVLGFPPERVVGMAGMLDTARFKFFVAQALGVSVRDVSAFVLGGHGDTMVPVPRACSVGGVPLTELLTKEQVDAIVERTRKGGAEVVALLKTGSAYYAPSVSAVHMARAVLKDERRVLPCAAYLKGEYGHEGLFVGVLCVLGGSGVHRVIELRLNSEERAALEHSVQAVRGLMEAVDKMGVLG